MINPIQSARLRTTGTFNFKYGRLEVEAPEKRFVAGCRLCPYMKLNALEKIRRCLAAPAPEQVVSVEPGIARRAARSLERMFELSPVD